MKKRTTLDLLGDYESRNVTYVDREAGWPIVWERAKGVYVWDETGKRYLDLTAAFGVAATGHANPRVVAAGRRQMGRLLHAMGDVHPHRLKAELACTLSRMTFERWKAGRGKTIFGNSGFEAVESALKTALLATGKPGVLAFEGGYHGLGYGALNATHREHFRGAFRSQLKEFGRFVRFPVACEELEKLAETISRALGKNKIGAILVEPIQARGGIRVPPDGFLSMLRRLCDRHGVLLILDEIYTGFGRTGEWFACEHQGVVPDLICLGKALTGGFPLSACVGQSELMDAAWPQSNGEAIHTSTFLGHPVGCAMALAQIKVIENSEVIVQSKILGEHLLVRLQKLTLPFPWQLTSRGKGLLCGLELLMNGKPATEASLALITRLLHRGFIFLPEGEHANVLSFTPPLTISRPQLDSAIDALADELAKTKP